MLFLRAAMPKAVACTSLPGALAGFDQFPFHQDYRFQTPQCQRERWKVTLCQNICQVLFIRAFVLCPPLVYNLILILFVTAHSTTPPMKGKTHLDKYRTLRISLLTLLNALIIGFIFFNSSRIGNASSDVSLHVLDIANRLLGKLGVSFSFSHLAIRKLGHLAEFALLGFWLMLSLRVYTKRLFAFLAWPMLIGLVVAVIDEFIQSFIPGRSSQVSDILIDFAGLLIGMFCALILELLARAIARSWRRRRNRKKNASIS